MRWLILGLLVIVTVGCTPTVNQPVQLTTTPVFKWHPPTKGSPVEKYRVQVYRNGQLDWELELQDNIASIQLNDIHIGDTFKVRVFAVDGKGRQGEASEFSEEFNPLINSAQTKVK